MRLPDGSTARPAEPADLDLVVALFRDVELALFGESENARLWIDEMWRSDWVDLATMSRLVFAPDGNLAASGGLESIDPADSVDAFIRVHPAYRGRGLGSGLVRWSEEATGRLIHSGATKLRNSTSAADAAALDLLSSAGYARVRTFWHMRMDLPEGFAAGGVPDGVTIRPSIEGDDDVGIYDAIQEAFRSHFGYVAIGFEQWWDNLRRIPGVEPSLTLVALEGDRIVGASIQFANDDVGWVGDLGVHPDAQGRGIGHALLCHALADLARRGFRVAQLSVDSQNETGATDLYRKVGMTLWREWPVFEKRVAAGVSSRP